MPEHVQIGTIFLDVCHCETFHGVLPIARDRRVLGHLWNWLGLPSCGMFDRRYYEEMRDDYLQNFLTKIVHFQGGKEVGRS